MFYVLNSFLINNNIYKLTYGPNNMKKTTEYRYVFTIDSDSGEEWPDETFFSNSDKEAKKKFLSMLKKDNDRSAKLMKMAYEKKHTPINTDDSSVFGFWPIATPRLYRITNKDADSDEDYDKLVYSKESYRIQPRGVAVDWKSFS